MTILEGHEGEITLKQTGAEVPGMNKLFRTKSGVLVSILIAFALVAAACGDDDSESGSSVVDTPADDTESDSPAEDTRDDCDEQRRKAHGPALPSSFFSDNETTEDDWR